MIYIMFEADVDHCFFSLTANTNLAVTNQGTIGPGTSLTFSASTLNGSTDVSMVLNLICLPSSASPILIAFYI